MSSCNDCSTISRQVKLLVNYKKTGAYAPTVCDCSSWMLGLKFWCVLTSRFVLESA